MHEIERWLESCVAPASRVGARLGVAPLFGPGAEEAAQAAIDLLLDHTRWNEVDVETVRVRLAQLPDIGQSVVAAQARAFDLVDAARIASFLDFFFAFFARWEREVAACGTAAPAAGARALLGAVHEAVVQGRMSDGYALQASMHPRLAPLHAALIAAQQAFAAWQERRVAALRELGVANAQPSEFLVMRATYDAVRMRAIDEQMRVVRETPDFVVCTPRYDGEALALLAEEQRVAGESEAVEAEILADIASTIADAADALEHAARWVAALDIALARRAFVVRYDLRRAVIGTERQFVCEDALYPPLRERVGPSYTPLTLAFDAAAVLSGANMGGKTNALMTAVLVAACARRGLPVPARGARTPLFTNVLWLGADDDRDAAGLSAFGREIAAVCTALEPRSRSFVALDEVGRTTSPGEGRALLVAILRGLIERGHVVLAATHLDHIAEDAGAAHFRLRGMNVAALSGAVTSHAQVLRTLEDAFDRRFDRVDGEEVRSSQAFEVARVLGLPDDVLRFAYEEFAH